MIDHTPALPVVRQGEILALMRLIDESHLELPFAGARMLRDLLRGLSIIRPNQAWAMDITDMTMTMTMTMTMDFYIEAVEEALARYGTPDIFNTDQGSPFTSSAFVGLLTEHGIRISMDGKGCWRDNVFVERLWKRVKYEEVYLHAYDTVIDAKRALARYFHFYNTRRPHSSLDGQTPDTVYFNSLPQQRAA